MVNRKKTLELGKYICRSLGADPGSLDHYVDEIEDSDEVCQNPDGSVVLRLVKNVGNGKVIYNLTLTAVYED